MYKNVVGSQNIEHLFIAGLLKACADEQASKLRFLKRAATRLLGEAGTFVLGLTKGI